jgi:hypothetical protein
MDENSERTAQALPEELRDGCFGIRWVLTFAGKVGIRGIAFGRAGIYSIYGEIILGAAICERWSRTRFLFFEPASTSTKEGLPRGIARHNSNYI